jgi:hypothetical protein
MSKLSNLIRRWAKNEEENKQTLADILTEQDERIHELQLGQQRLELRQQRVEDALRQEGVQDTIARGAVTSSAHLDHETIGRDYQALVFNMMPPLTEQAYPMAKRGGQAGDGVETHLVHDRARMVSTMTHHLFSPPYSDVTEESTLAALEHDGHPTNNLDPARLARVVKRASELRQRAAELTPGGCWRLDVDVAELRPDQFDVWNREGGHGTEVPEFLVAPGYFVLGEQPLIPQLPYVYVKPARQTVGTR